MRQAKYREDAAAPYELKHILTHTGTGCLQHQADTLKTDKWVIQSGICLDTSVDHRLIVQLLLLFACSPFSNIISVVL